MTEQFLTAVINGHVVRVTLAEWEALRAEGPTDELIARIQARLNARRED